MKTGCRPGHWSCRGQPGARRVRWCCASGRPCAGAARPTSASDGGCAAQVVLAMPTNALLVDPLVREARQAHKKMPQMQRCFEANLAALKRDELPQANSERTKREKMREVTKFAKAWRANDVRVLPQLRVFSANRLRRLAQDQSLSLRFSDSL